MKVKWINVNMVAVQFEGVDGPELYSKVPEGGDRYIRTDDQQHRSYKVRGPRLISISVSVEALSS